ncbi:hypothetical protein VTJ83DRAFT_7590 [Remersonia thermophila]|uniref:Secreted protein n=1 Tax=Remersonia thermophila TaxID=72144 RepID=A0ABR4D4X2_9PEZI
MISRWMVAFLDTATLLMWSSPVPSSTYISETLESWMLGIRSFDRSNLRSHSSIIATPATFSRIVPTRIFLRSVSIVFLSTSLVTKQQINPMMILRSRYL